MDADSLKRLNIAELMSSIGALLLRIGLQASTARWIGPASGLLVLLGSALHARGMILRIGPRRL